MGADTRSPSDPFATLGIARSFSLDLPAVEKTHRELSRALHPDRYVSAPPGERRAALAKAVLVNEAWRTVRDPIARAEALFALAGVDVGETSAATARPDFLMEMMEQREALAEARAGRDAAAVERLARAIAAQTAAAERALDEGFAKAEGRREEVEPLAVKLSELRFYRRAFDEIRAIQEELEG